MEAFIEPLRELAEFDEISSRICRNEGLVQVAGCVESQKAHFIYGLSGLFPYRLILAPDEQRAKQLYEDYRFYDRNVCYYPAKDLLFFQADIHGNLLIKQRMQVIRSMLEQEEVTVVTSVDGCMDCLIPLKSIYENLIHLEAGSTIDLEELERRLSWLGYERVSQVESSGQFAVRGGILDVYSLTEENPWRIEMWGDEVDSIRSFDAYSQRSIENLEKITAKTSCLICSAFKSIKIRNRKP